MRLIKMFGLAAVGAVAAMAFLGAGTAYSTVIPAHHKVGLCKVQVLLLCPATPVDSRVPVGSGHVVGFATNPTLEGTLTETCKTGNVTGLITGTLDELAKLAGKIDVVTFKECSPCTEVTVENLPYSSELTMPEIGGTAWELNTSGTIKATLNKCVFGSGSCIFGAATVKAAVEMAETGATVNTNKAPLEFKGGTLGEGFCGKIGKWNAKYAIKWLLLPGGEEDLVFPTLLGEEEILP
jgi:hypothetical protein